MVPNRDVFDAQQIIQQEFPSQRGSGMKLCGDCIGKEGKLKKIGSVFAVWIALQEAFLFKSFCPRCRRFIK